MVSIWVIKSSLGRSWQIVTFRGLPILKGNLWEVTDAEFLFSPVATLSPNNHRSGKWLYLKGS